LEILAAARLGNAVAHTAPPSVFTPSGVESDGKSHREKHMAAALTETGIYHFWRNTTNDAPGGG
jgi:hypothetical protein